MKILIADDSAIYRVKLERILSNWEYEVTVAEDGESAWEILQQDHAPRLAILDWIMPGMDGTQVCEKIRQQKQEPYTYILLLTAKTEKKDIIAGLHYGADDYLTKPFDNHELELRLRVGKRIIELQEHLIAAREAMRDSEERYRSLMRNIPIGVFRNAKQLDGQFRCIAANPSIAKMFGFESIEEFMQYPIRDCFANEEDLIRFNQQFREKNFVINAEYLMKKKDGSLFWASISGQVIRNEQGDFLYTDGTIEDISQRVRLEKQLRQSQKMESIGQLASGIAHDFNNVLMSIKINSDFVLHALKEDDPIRKDMEEIKQASKRASSITSKLLSLSQKQTYPLEILSLKNIVEELEERIRQELGETIQCSFDIDPDTGQVKTERDKIEQAILNLTINAHEAMPQGGRFIIGLQNQGESLSNSTDITAPVSYVVLTISDTGCGMDQETQTNIFNPFFTTKNKGNEGGLGLTTVYGIVKQSGGFIEVYSEPGRGTTFQIYLPRIE